MQLILKDRNFFLIRAFQLKSISNKTTKHNSTPEGLFILLLPLLLTFVKQVFILTIIYLHSGQRATASRVWIL